MWMRTRWQNILVASLLGLGAPAVVCAQADSVRTRPPAVPPVRADTVKPAPISPTQVVPIRRGANGRVLPPLSPKRAFIYSALLPGLGQSRLDRGSSGALFASVELAALVMVRRSLANVREARRFRTDTLDANFTASGDDRSRNGTFVGRYTSDLVRTRRLHVEDWLAVIAFNHLFSGADAFVSAQLWELPTRISAVPTMNGPLVMASFSF